MEITGSRDINHPFLRFLKDKMRLDKVLSNIGIEPINYFEQINSINGHGKYCGQDIYYKFSPKDRGLQELENTGLFSKFYPTPKLVDFFEVNDGTVLLLYDYHPELETLEGIMAGWLRSDSPETTVNSNFWEKFTDCITSAYDRTLHIDTKNPRECPGELINKVRGQNGKKMDIMFGGKNWPALDYLSNIRTIIVGGKEVKFNIDDIRTELKEFCYSKDPTSYAVTHGNLSELNIGCQPLFFDTSTAGINPILIDTFSFLWHTENACGYLIPRYVSSKIPRFPELLLDTYDFDPWWEWNQDKTIIEINFRKQLPEHRANIVNDWMKRIVEPMVEEGKKVLHEWDWKSELYNYCMLRTIKAQRLVSDINNPDKIFFIGQMGKLIDWKKNDSLRSPYCKND